MMTNDCATAHREGDCTYHSGTFWVNIVDDRHSESDGRCECECSQHDDLVSS